MKKIIWKDRKRTFLGLPLSFTVYTLTEDKLYTRIGLFSLKEDEVELYRVIDKSKKKSLGERIFGCGTIILDVQKDKDTPVKILKGVKNVDKVYDLIDEQININRDKYRVKGRDMIGDITLEGDIDGFSN
jgi:hypothetical protein